MPYAAAEGYYDHICRRWKLASARILFLLFFILMLLISSMSAVVWTRWCNVYVLYVVDRCMFTHTQSHKNTYLTTHTHTHMHTHTHAHIHKLVLFILKCCQLNHNYCELSATLYKIYSISKVGPDVLQIL